MVTAAAERLDEQQQPQKDWEGKRTEEAATSTRDTNGTSRKTQTHRKQQQRATKTETEAERDAGPHARLDQESSEWDTRPVKENLTATREPTSGNQPEQTTTQKRQKNQDRPIEQRKTQIGYRQKHQKKQQKWAKKNQKRKQQRERS